MNFKKYFSTFIFVSIFFTQYAFAIVEAPIPEQVVAVDKKGFINLDLVKERVGEFLKVLENTRLHYVIYFQNMRDENKAIFTDIDIKDTKNSTKPIDIAGVPETKVAKVSNIPSMDQFKNHFVEYTMYFFSSSLFSFFNSKGTFYAGLILLTLVMLRFILRRFL